MTRSGVDWRPQARIRDPKLMALLKHEYDCCEITGLTFDLHLHHVLLRSRGGDDLRANIVCLVIDLHNRYHEGDEGVRLMLAIHIAANRPDTMDYLARKLSESGRSHWFSRHGMPGK